MPRPPNFPAQFQLRILGWKAIAVGLAILVAIIAALVLLTIGFFIIILPLMILAPVLYYFVPKLRTKLRYIDDNVTKQATDSGAIIDGEFKVVDTCAAEEQIAIDTDIVTKARVAK
jgi:UPF0716 family protein affecting phage T7 exclusion